MFLIFGKQTLVFEKFLFFWKFWIFGSILDYLDFSNALSNHYTVAWVTRPENPKGVKDDVKHQDF